MTGTRALFDRVLDDEPPLALTLEPVVAAGRRVRRRRRAAYGASALSLAAVAVAAAGPVLHDEGAAVRPVRPAAPTAPQRQQVDPALTPMQRAVAQAVIDASPAGWRFDFAPDRWTGAGVEATVDDGRGAVRLLVGVSGDGQLLRPCRDPEFPEGGACAEKPQPSGAMLSTRTAWHDAYEMEYVHAVLTNADGSGVLLESGNAALKWPLPQVATAQEKKDLFTVVREHPVYDEELLGAVALAVDRAVRGAGGYPAPDPR